MKQIIKLNRSIIPSCDVPQLEALSNLVKETCYVEGIGGYKIGLEICLKFGIPKVVETIKRQTKLPIIYDHQKAATDNPEMGIKFAEAVKGVDAVILFPLSGPVTEKSWIKACKKANLGVIVGGEMTHGGFLKSDNGFVDDTGPKKIYEIAARLGVRDFVVPGNKPEKIRMYKAFLEACGIKPILYSPGLIVQGGSITKSSEAAGDNWHAIVGRALYESKNIRQSAKDMVKLINQKF